MLSSSSLALCVFLVLAAVTKAQYYPSTGMAGGMGMASSMGAMGAGHGMATAMGSGMAGGMGAIGSGMGMASAMGNSYGIDTSGYPARASIGYPAGYPASYPSGYSAGYPTGSYPASYPTSMGMGMVGGIGGPVVGVSPFGLQASDNVNENSNTNINVNGASFRRSLHLPSTENVNTNTNVNSISDISKADVPQDKAA